MISFEFEFTVPGRSFR